MTKRSVNSPFYYSAPLPPQEEEDFFIDPFMDIPSLDDKEERPGDLFRTFGAGESLINEPKSEAENRANTRIRAGKLNWPFGL